MIDTLDYILRKFDLPIGAYRKLPIEIPNFGRVQLADLLHELDFKTGVEVGVAWGWYSSVLMAANPQMQLDGVDPWFRQKGYRDYTRGATFEKLLDEAHSRLDQYHNFTFVRKTSMDAVEDYKDNSLDFVYIDADHSFKQVTDDIHEWLQKVRPGGIISGHDYATSKGVARMHVKHVVPAYTRAWGIKPWFVLGNEANDEGLVRDRPRSWLWIK